MYTLAINDAFSHRFGVKILAHKKITDYIIKTHFAFYIFLHFLKKINLKLENRFENLR
jgi:hypothetical protein